MSFSIAEQTWEMVSPSLQQSARNRREEEAHSAQAHRLGYLQQMEKDVILPSDIHGRLASKENGSTGKGILLPAPTNNWSAFEQAGADQRGLISIIGAVLALQAKTNSNFWSTVWKQASASMMAQVKFAPIIGKAITNQYDAESKKSQADSDMAFWGGIVNLVAFGATVATGLVNGWNPKPDPSKAVAYTKQDLIENPQLEEDIAEEGENPVNKTAESEKETASDIINNEDGTRNGEAYMQKGQSLASRGLKFMARFIKCSVEASQMWSALSNGISQLAVNHVYEGKKAQYATAEGVAASQSKECEMYAQFYGQDFSREEDLRQGSQQNLDYALNILQQAANTITATVRSMFGG